MKRKSLPLLIALFLSMVCIGKLHAQLIVTEAAALNGWTADSLVRNVLLNDGVTISHARFNGLDGVIECNNIGIFETGFLPTNLGMESGLILATGGVNVAVGPNNDDGFNEPTTCGSYYDIDLASIASGTPNDVAVLEFDFIPWDNGVSFSFVFGSEEYMEFVGTDYNDVFGFFVDGINPLGGYYTHENMALIPETTEVVSIDNVNQNHNSAYYIDNTGGSSIQFDGFTTVIEVSFDVIPMSNYHIKMAICDVGDDAYDSGVFLEAHSFTTNLSYSMTIDDWVYTEIPENHYFCSNQGIEFNTVTNWNYDDVVWYFGDGTSAQGEQASHTYAADGFYTVTNVIHNPHRATDSIFLSKTIEVKTLLSEEFVTACDSYVWHGNTCTESGTYTDVVPILGTCDSIYILNLVMGESYSTEETVTTCNQYIWRGNTYTQSGTYTDFVQSPGACDSTFVLNLTLGHDVQSDTTAVTCNTFTWHGNTYTESGDYSCLLQTPLGCDSIVTLHLTIGQELIHPTEVEMTCENSFTWRGHNYSLNGVYYDTVSDAAGCNEIYVLDLTFVESYNTYLIETVCDKYPWKPAEGGYLTKSGNYRYEGKTQDGCDSIVDLNLTVHYTPAPLIAYKENDYYKDGDTIPVITNTEFFSFQYDFFVEDSLGHFDNWDSCVWHISKESWRIMPNPAEYQNETDRRYCRVYVADHSDIPTTLECVIYNSHCEPTIITKKFYLKSSFFDVDEQDASRLSFEVIPNPNNGVMELRFDNMEGKVEVKVYDMMGNLLDSFVTYNDVGPKAIQYNLSGRKGIYFFVANGKEGILTQKVVVK